MAYKKWRSGGFSIVELLIGTALISVITLLVVTVYIAHFRLYSNQTTNIDLSSQNSLAIKDISSEIRESQSVAVSCCSSPSENASNNKLVLQLWAIDKTTGEPNSSVYDYIIYKLDSNNNLLKRIVADPISLRTTGTRVVAPNVSSVRFNYDDVSPVSLTAQVTINLTLARQYDQKTISNLQNIKVYLRNKQ